jgi:hypothetical protein
MREAAPHPATGRGDPARPRRRLGGATRRVRDAGSAGRPGASATPARRADRTHRTAARQWAERCRAAPGATAISTTFDFEPRASERVRDAPTEIILVLRLLAAFMMSISHTRTQ